MKDSSIKELRKILIEFLLSVENNKLTKDEIIEASIFMHHLFQPDTYEENRKALQKVLDRKHYR